jgi:Flp pilus assembly protein TadB
VSRQRALVRAERERVAAARAAELAAQRQQLAARRAREQRRSAAWRQMRLWRGRSRRHRELWATLASVLLVVLVATYLVTRSLGAVLLVLLVFCLAAPAAVVLSTRRS